MAGALSFSKTKTNSSATKSRRILVVDDEPVVSEAACIMLDYLGHTVEAAASAKEALERFKNQEFDLVFTDYAMPEMKGDQMAEIMKSLRPGQPVAMITAYAEVLPTMNAVDMVIAKPFLLKHLQEAIDRLIKG